MVHDVIVVGGSYAGMAAALQLARARRSVVVIDGGLRRNRFAASAHGFLSQDGRAPHEIAEDARMQLLAYPTVQWITGTAVEASRTGDSFSIQTGDGRALEANRVILATGVADYLPDIPGLAENWGRGVFHCPYCHGYELDGPLGVLAVGPISMHHAMLVPEWGPTTLFLNGALELDDDASARLASRGVAVEREIVAAIEGPGAVVSLRDGRTIALAGLFTAPRTAVNSPLPAQLGCTLEAGPMGSFIQTDPMKRTTVPGVFACGDAARAAGSVSFAVGDGAMAGAGAHQSLVFGLNI